MVSIFHKIAGVSGALAIALGAYGSHGNSSFLPLVIEVSHFCGTPRPGMEGPTPLTCMTVSL